MYLFSKTGLLSDPVLVLSIDYKRRGSLKFLSYRKPTSTLKYSNTDRPTSHFYSNMLTNQFLKRIKKTKIETNRIKGAFF